MRGRASSWIEQETILGTMYWRLLFWVALTDVAFAAAGPLVFAAKASGFACQLQAWSFEFFARASALWIACLTHFLGRVILGRWAIVSWVGDYRSGAGGSVAQPLTAEDATRLELCYHAFVWGLCTLLLMIPLSDGIDERGYPKAYGIEPAGWCYIDNKGANGQLWVLLSYATIWAVVAYIIVTVLQCRRALRRDRLFKEAVLGRQSTQDDAEQKAKDELYRHLIGYPIILCLVWVWPSVRRVWIIIDLKSEQHELGWWGPTLQLGFISLLGFFNCAYFLYANPLRRVAERNYMQQSKHDVPRARWGSVYASALGSVGSVFSVTSSLLMRSSAPPTPTGTLRAGVVKRARPAADAPRVGEGEGVALTVRTGGGLKEINETSVSDDVGSRLTSLRSKITLGGSNVAEWGSFGAPPSERTTPVRRGDCEILGEASGGSQVTEVSDSVKL